MARIESRDVRASDVDRSDLSELHYIAAISNVPSIMARGILSFRQTMAIRHVSVAMLEVQRIRAKRAIPGGRPLHDYVNLYLGARNPMLYRRRDRHAELCVLRVSTEVLDLPGVVIADGNAASKYTAFWPSPLGLGKIDSSLVFAEYWTDADQIAGWHKKRVKCAEVLVPDSVDPRFVFGAYVSCDDAQRSLQAGKSHLSVTIDTHLFFR
jgi:hypothetical protein